MEQLRRMQEPARSRKAWFLESANSSGVDRAAVRRLDAVEKCLKTMGFRNRGERWKMGKMEGRSRKGQDSR